MDSSTPSSKRLKERISYLCLNGTQAIYHTNHHKGINYTTGLSCTKHSVLEKSNPSGWKLTEKVKGDEKLKEADRSRTGQITIYWGFMNSSKRVARQMDSTSKQ
jgi:hypothetical protein